MIFLPLGSCSNVTEIRLTYSQGLILFFCSFLALRFDDRVSRVEKITDFYIDNEDELFGG